MTLDETRLQVMLPESDRTPEDLRKLKGMLYHPAVSLIAPFTPFMTFANHPASFIVLILPVLDYFNLPGRLSRKYIAGYGYWYVFLFASSVAVRLVMELVDIVYWIIPMVVVPFVVVIWGKFAWVEWWKLYNLAQKD